MRTRLFTGDNGERGAGIGGAVNLTRGEAGMDERYHDQWRIIVSLSPVAISGYHPRRGCSIAGFNTVPAYTVAVLHLSRVVTP
jgi:hypothetical protein